MIQSRIHEQIVTHCDRVCEWFENKSKGLVFPIYASFDVRDSGQKIAPVDANIFPAGFNNICPADKGASVAILKKYLETHYPTAKKIALLTEEHTTNTYYWENVLTLFNLLSEAGHSPKICIPSPLEKAQEVKSSSGHTLTINPAEVRNGLVYIGGEEMDLVICNNDFSDGYAPWTENLQTPINPPHELGWYRRRKFSFFQQYNKLAEEFATLLDLPPIFLQVETAVAGDIEVDDVEKREALATTVDNFLANLKEKYTKDKIEAEPFAFLKNNAGTYGLAVVQAHSGDEIRSWNNKTRKKMKAAKGGHDVTELIVQEGITTQFHDAGVTAEPCIYTIGGELVGGFLRTHSEKGPDESLNSPGAVFKKLCMADLVTDMSDCPMENVYGWIAKLGVLAIALEAKAAAVHFHGYA
jgi:glutamate--cysteine ligase